MLSCSIYTSFLPLIAHQLRPAKARVWLACTKPSARLNSSVPVSYHWPRPRGVRNLQETGHTSGRFHDWLPRGQVTKLQPPVHRRRVHLHRMWACACQGERHHCWLAQPGSLRSRILWTVRMRVGQDEVRRVSREWY